MAKVMFWNTAQTRVASLKRWNCFWYAKNQNGGLNRKYLYLCSWQDTVATPFQQLTPIFGVQEFNGTIPNTEVGNPRWWPLRYRYFLFNGSHLGFPTSGYIRQYPHWCHWVPRPRKYGSILWNFVPMCHGCWDTACDIYVGKLWLINLRLSRNWPEEPSKIFGIRFRWNVRPCNGEE